MVIVPVLSLPRTEDHQASRSVSLDPVWKVHRNPQRTGILFRPPLCSGCKPAARARQSGDVESDSKFNVTVSQSGNVSLDSRLSKKVSLKILTLSNSRQKVNDALGNPVEIGVAVMWRVVDTAKAVFNVDNYKEYLSLQCDSAVRDIVRIYPYDMAPGIDTTGDGQPDEGSLRGSSTIVAERIRKQLQEKVKDAGLEILETRITYLAYAPEIAQ